MRADGLKCCKEFARGCEVTMIADGRVTILGLALIDTVVYE